MVYVIQDEWLWDTCVYQSAFANVCKATFNATSNSFKVTQTVIFIRRRLS